jgi:tripartite-type tricarboxylate transporter receptor subunit TctC
MSKFLTNVGAVISSAVSLAVLTAAALLVDQPAKAQAFPSRAIRIITYPAGGGADFGARVLADGLTSNSHWQAIVDNRAGGVIQGELLMAAPPDGYTLLYAGTALWLTPFTQKTVPYDPVHDFAAVSMTAIAPNILTIHPSLPVRSVRQLIALAKARPGELNYTSGPDGNPNMLAGELFKSMAGINLVRVNYSGQGPAVIALLSGEMQIGFSSAPSAMQYVKSGRLRALAVTTAQPSPLAPGLPTMAASGLPGFEVVSTYGVLAPLKTAASVISTLNREVVRALNTPEVKAKFLSVGTQTAPSTPNEFQDAIKSEMAKFGKVIKEASQHG